MQGELVKNYIYIYIYMRNGGSQAPVCEIRHSKGKTKMISVRLISARHYGFEYTVVPQYPQVMIPQFSNYKIH